LTVPREEFHGCWLACCAGLAISNWSGDKSSILCLLDDELVLPWKLVLTVAIYIETPWIAFGVV